MSSPEILGPLILLAVGCQSERGLLDDTFRELHLRTKSPEHFFVQLSDHHIMRFGYLRNLDDLGGIYPIDALPHLPGLNCRFEDSPCARMVLDRYCSTDRGPDEIYVDLLCLDPCSSRRRRATRVLRRMKRTIRNDFPRTDLIRRV